MNSASLILGIDGGGTKTVAWLAARDDPSERGILGRGRAGPANPRAVSLAEVIANLEQAVGAAFADAHLAPCPVARACLGLAGAGRDDERRAIQRWADRRRLAARTVIVPDAVPLLWAGAPEGWGIALISGTGSFAFGQDAAGHTARCGGWGRLFGDEGSGYAIALAGLRAAARAADGRGPPTTLLEAILKQFDLTDPSQIISAIYDPSMDHASIAGLAPLILQAARQGDTPASGIVRQAAADLAEMASAVANQLGFSNQPVPLAMAGGVLLQDENLCHALLAALSRRGVAAGPVAKVKDPVAGALRIARDG